MESNSSHVKNAGLEIRVLLRGRWGGDELFIPTPLAVTTRGRRRLHSYLPACPLAPTSCEEMMDSDQIDKFGERTGLSETDLLFPLYLGAKCLQKAQPLI